MSGGLPPATVYIVGCPNCPGAARGHGQNACPLCVGAGVLFLSRDPMVLSPEDVYRRVYPDAPDWRAALARSRP